MLASSLASNQTACTTQRGPDSSLSDQLTSALLISSWDQGKL